MIICITLIFLLNLLNYSFALFNCPSSFGLFSDPIRCTNYYECENWIPVSKVCGSGLFFNQAMKICDWPDNVDQSGCSSSINNSERDDLNKNNGSPNIANSNHIKFICHADGLYEDPVSCIHYLECFQGSPYRKICPSNLHFDIRIKGCNWPESTECSKHLKPLTTTRPQISIKPIYKPNNTPKYIPYTPKYTEPNTYETPPAELTENNNINSKQTTSNPFSENNCDWCFKCPNQEDKYYKNDHDKYTYYHCFEGTAYLMYCPRESIWVQQKQTCKSEKNPSGKNKEEKLNESSYDNSEDGAGLIDARMKKKTNYRTGRMATKLLNS